MDTLLCKKAVTCQSLDFNNFFSRGTQNQIRRSSNSTNQYWRATQFLLTKNASKIFAKYTSTSTLLFYPANTKFMRLISLNQYNTTSRLKRNPICGRPIYHLIQKFEKLRHKQKNIANLIIGKTLERALRQAAR